MIIVFSLSLDKCLDKNHTAERCSIEISAIVFGTLKSLIGILLIVATLMEIRCLLVTYLTFAGIGLVLDFAYFFEVTGGGKIAYDVTAFLISIYGFIVVFSFQSELESREQL